MSRDDIADSLPGVAISISLVPPLCVVGIGLSAGQWYAAWGAMLLFLTNFLSILLAGGGTLALLGLGAAATVTLQEYRRRRAFLFIVLGVLLISVPLTATTIRVSREALTEYRIVQPVKEWLAPTNYEPGRIDAEGDVMKLVIVGQGELPPLSDLELAIESRT